MLRVLDHAVAWRQDWAIVDLIWLGLGLHDRGRADAFNCVLMVESSGGVDGWSAKPLTTGMFMCIPDGTMWLGCGR